MNVPEFLPRRVNWVLDCDVRLTFYIHALHYKTTGENVYDIYSDCLRDSTVTVYLTRWNNTCGRIWQFATGRLSRIDVVARIVRKLMPKAGKSVLCYSGKSFCDATESLCVTKLGVSWKRQVGIFYSLGQVGALPRTSESESESVCLLIRRPIDSSRFLSQVLLLGTLCSGRSQYLNDLRSRGLLTDSPL
jgi:hypothetical protein